MNIRGLQEWIFTNSEEDQWWICTDNITKETPVTIDEIEKVALSGDFKKIQVLHTSQSNMSNPPWVLLEVVEKLPSSPIRMNNSLVSNRNLPPPPLPYQSQGVEKKQNSYGKVDELLGIISLTIPLISCLAIWFWVGSMALIQNPGSSLQIDGKFLIFWFFPGGCGSDPARRFGACNGLPVVLLTMAAGCLARLCL